MDKRAEKTIADILERGNDAEIRQKPDGYVIIEVRKELKYRAPARWGAGSKGKESQES